MKKNKPAALIITVATFFLAAAAVVVSVFVFRSWRESADALLYINPYGGVRDSIDTIAVSKEYGSLMLYLPAGANRKKLTVWYNESRTVTVNSAKLENGVETSVFSGRDSFKINISGTEYTLKIEQSVDAPALFLVTKSGDIEQIVQDKNNKESGRALVRENGETSIDAELEHIKGRGNHWSGFGGAENTSRPYNIKFTEKQSLLGMAPAKKWVLKPSAIIQDKCAYSLARRMDLGFTPDLRFADVYLNNYYIGKYQVSSSVQIGKNRVDITDLKDLNEDANPSVPLEEMPHRGTRYNVSPGSKKWVDIPNDPKEITGGYLLEMDDPGHYEEEVSGFITDRGFALVIKDPEYATKSEVEYIAAYWQEAEDALYSESGYNSQGKHYSEYFDFDSIVRMYILQELTKNADAGVTSCFFYKDAGEKLFAGPVWDFDAALGQDYSYEGLDLGDPSTWWVNQRVRDWSDDFPMFFGTLYSHNDFRAAVTDIWQECSDIWLNDGFYSELSDFGNALASTSAGIFSSRSASVKETQQKIIRFLAERKTALDRGFSADSAFVRYDPTGGRGHLYESGIYIAGDSVILKDNAYSKEGAVFKGWSLIPDGEAEYLPGDKVTLDAGYHVFYAVWE
ncbi:MAG: CotH kinase family protein [Clostridia bacterium]|nr:CotH kinase family protein [Clostridia bacterium]